VTDWILLRKFKDDRSEAAFSEIVDRYSGMVYATCYAQLQDRQLAEDATQAVFLILARKSELRRGATMAGWLFRTARYVSMHQRRADIRQRRLLSELAQAHARTSETQSSTDTRLILTEGLDRLGDVEREAVLLRYYQGMTLADVGAELEISEEAARKRIDRGIDKLRRYLAGVDGIAAGLALSTLTNGGASSFLTDVQHQELVHLITSSATSFQPAVITSAHQLTTEVLSKMLLTKLRVAALLTTVAIVGGSGGAYVWGHVPTDAGRSTVVERPISQPFGGYPGQPPADTQGVRKREQAIKRESMSRLKRLGLAMIQSMTRKHFVPGQIAKATFPNMDWHALHKTLHPYLKSDEDFFQPGISQPYHFNKVLSGTELADIADPATVPLAYETSPSIDGLLNVVFLDGRVEGISIEKWKDLNPDFNRK